MHRSMAIAALSLAVGGTLQFAPAPAVAQSEADSATRAAITVEAPRARQTGRSAIGAPIETLTARSVVYIDDLNLTTETGRAELGKRVSAAADQACKWLDEVYPLSASSSTSGDCRRDAVKSAQAQVDAAIRLGG